MKPALVTDLQRLLRPGAVTDTVADLKCYASDALGSYRAFRASHSLGRLPQVVVHPRSTEEVATVAAYASERGVPLVPRGGGTGVMGAAIPVKGSIVLDLRGLAQVKELDPEARSVVVGAGTLLEDLALALQKRGLLLGHDPWSLPIATVGGAISTNGVGYLAGKYGSMGQQVLGLEVVLTSGQVLPPTKVSKTAGPSLEQLFIGSEGSLGIITWAVLEAFPAPEAHSLHAFRFPSFEAGFSATQEMHALGLRPALVDFAEEFSPASGNQGEITLYLGFHGFREEVEAQYQRGLGLCRRHKGEELHTGQAQDFWDQRHASAERYKREVLAAPLKARQKRGSWRMDYLHVAIPASRVLEYREECRQVLRAYRIPVREWSIWARPEFFSFLIADPEPHGKESSERMAAAVDKVLMTAQDLGGTMEYCHGVGLKLGHLMGRERGPGLATLQKVKQALDPAGVLNPSKLGLG